MHTTIDLSMSMRLSGFGDSLAAEGSDYLGLTFQPKFQQMIGSQKLMFSDKIKKINMFGWVQQRYFLITNEKVYNIKKTKIKRSIPINNLSGITKNLQGSKREFTLHVNSEYDYRFQSDKRDEIIGILKTAYAERNGINLPIFGVPRSNLLEFTTTEKDKNRGTSRFPPPQFRLLEEDLLRDAKET